MEAQNVLGKRGWHSARFHDSENGVKGIGLSG